MWSKETRGRGVSIYSIAVNSGLALGSIIGAALIIQPNLWWRWTAYIHTANPPCHKILPYTTSVFVKCGVNIIFLQYVKFLIDLYKTHAASATAPTTFLRSLMAASLPLAARPMIRALGVRPIVSTIAAVATALQPVPFLFLRYGTSIIIYRRLRLMIYDSLVFNLDFIDSVPVV
ncbi:uncharacterized protein N7446_012778 [Penicillium canescens]|uniref:Uncharacterized protein n=1 Tax=Penicillium canescens TaxID=5083 RepID=A0AAD6HXQ9_PENCN|nr:uncharacterized protein N7446_012778 [Penicillium canescens]KAJ6022425.1 hypothetical protein N7460_012820 [Penicillium canescens]KAJ6026315.1 hypothetical protein N7444_013994 [Penicillium canescens]KAJ6041712.1 hypothetical protein N7446_012778 [Penicillium canescens]KAJ6158073.1 hypothetical protein N7485_010899 [Penicillium canescens]